MRERVVRAIRSETARAALGGLLLALAAPPFPAALSALSFLGVVLLASAIDRASVRQAAVRGLFFGLFANLVAMSFVPQTITRFTDLPLLAALLGWVLLSLGQGTVFAVAGFVAGAASRWLRAPMPLALGLGVGVSMLVPALFPWTIAAPLARAPVFLQAAEIVGERGVAVLVAIAAGLAARAFSVRGPARRRHTLAASLVLFGLLAYGVARKPSIEAALARAERRTVALVQQNVPPKDRWKQELAPEIVLKLWRLTRSAEQQGAELAIWPESAYPYVLPHRPSIDAGAYRIRGPGISIEVMTGLLTDAPPPPDENDPHARWHYNATTLVDRQGNVAQPSAKLELLAFGEVVPLGDTFPVLRRIFVRGGGLRAGERPILLETKTAPVIRAGILNCYEDTIASVSRRIARENPNLLVNVTNDAWFGPTAEPELHLLEAIPRAIEARRDLLRAVNTGVTVHVDAFGRVVARAPREVEAVLLVRPALLESGPTPYVRFGDALWLLPLSIAALTSRALHARARSR